jgi:DMSO reductase anchor subunit
VPRTTALVALALGFVLTSLGLLSSTLHLGKPLRAWRAFSQWRSSWLSREGVLALSCLLPAGWFAIATWRGLDPRMAGALLGVFSLATVACTAMIYVSLKPIPAWRHAVVLPVYLLFALLTGGLILCRRLCHIGIAVDNDVASAMLLGSFMLWRAKRFYWRDLDRGVLPATRAAAVGLPPDRDVRVFERPHTEANYLTREMGFMLARKHSRRLRLLALILFALVPALCAIAMWLFAQHETFAMAGRGGNVGVGRGAGRTLAVFCRGQTRGDAVLLIVRRRAAAGQPSNNSSAPSKRSSAATRRPRPSGSLAFPTALVRTDLSAARLPDHAFERKQAAVARRVRADRHVTAAMELPVHRPLGFDAEAGIGVIEFAQQGVYFGIVFARLDGDRALGDRRQPARSIEPMTDIARQPQTVQAGAGEDDRVVVAGFELRDPRVDVAAQILDIQIRSARTQLRLPSHRGRADDRPARKRIEIAEAHRDEGIERIGALEYRRQRERAVQRHRHVLERMHRRIGIAFQHRDFKFLEEQTLAADIGQRLVLDLVAAGGHRHQHDFQVRDAGRADAPPHGCFARARARSCGWRVEVFSCRHYRVAAATAHPTGASICRAAPVRSAG